MTIGLDEVARCRFCGKPPSLDRKDGLCSPCGSRYDYENRDYPNFAGDTYYDDIYGYDI